jgi:ArsR family transcriptional regulator
MDRLASVFKALGDETRLSILALLLQHGELCVCDFEGALGITQSKSSRHLRYLLNAGLVQNRRQGQWMHYRIAGKPDAATRAILASLRRSMPAEQVVALSGKLESWFETKHAGCCESA